MGNATPQGKFDDITERLEAKVGKIPLSGRYHRLPQRIQDSYAIQSKVLGSGYNGVVRMATSKAQKDQKFAIKAFKMANVTADKKGQLEGEIEIFLTMDHPHITRLVDVYEAEDYLHLVMECMEGGELFDRVTELKKFSEHDAADAVWQMLLALNYIHGAGIVHRDLKLENFLYDLPGSNHLKLIDFGFSKIWDPNIKMHVSCGTLSYVAPEVLAKSYTSQCDLWSLGVIVFILLAGYMPFYGSETQQVKNISAGKFTMKPDRWNHISKQAKNFTQSLLQVSPEKRLTAQSALEHTWIAQRKTLPVEIDGGIVDGLRQFGQASKFRRCCLSMMAWSLSNEERAQVRQYFIAMDKDKEGTISLMELKEVLQSKFQIPDDETQGIFNALDSNQDDTIHYSDFLAAMVSTRIALHDDLLRTAFRKFDTDSSGYITVDNLREILGDSFDGDEVKKLVAEADILKDGRVSFPEFVAYLRGEPLEMHAEATCDILDRKLTSLREGSSGNSSGLDFLKGVPMMVMKKRSSLMEALAPAAAPQGGAAKASAKPNDAATGGCCVIA